MLLDPNQCYEALQARDTRFDGLFFVGVQTTGIYCRPVCPARTPRRERCRFFPNAAGAEHAGFRPCLRCRPELAPGNARVDAVSRAAAAAARRIEDGAMNEEGLEALAEEMGLSSRQLRRAMHAELGVSPVQYAQTQRLLLAKRLLTETALPVTEVAFASGFSSIRRFNALFRERYRLNPTEIRHTSARRLPLDSLVLQLAYRPPFDWEALIGFLADRAYAGVEAVSGGRYLRTARIGGHSGWICVEPLPGKHALRAEVSPGLAPVLLPVLARLKHLFDLAAEPARIAAHLAADPLLEPLVARRPGLRVPGAFDGFELALRAVLGQQVTIAAATTLAARFVRAFAELIETPHPELTHLPIAPEAVAAAEIGEIAALGMPASRAVTIREVAHAAAEGAIRLEPGTGVEAAMEALQQLPGIGPWTAQYVALRALRWPDAFPHSDLWLRRALGSLPVARLLERVEPWRPWRAYAAMHLWKSLENPGGGG